MGQRITLIRVRKNPQENINEELQWIGNSLGLFNLRDRDSSCFRIFITLVKSSHSKEALSSDEIAGKLGLSRGTVVHHLHRLKETGVVLKEREGYLLRESTLESLMGDLQRDVEALIGELKKVAKEIDEKMG